MPDERVNPETGEAVDAPPVPHPDSFSVLDADFAKVWAEVYAEGDDEEAGEESGEAGAAAAGDEASAAGGTGAGTGAEATQPPAGGAQPAPGAGTGGQPAVPDASTAAQSGQSAVVPPAAGEGLDALTVIPQLATASEQITTRISQSFMAAAQDEIRSKADPLYFEALAVHPYRLVGRKVPGLSPNAPDITLRDSKEAQDWQEATRQMFDEEAKSLVRDREKDIQPLMGVLQDSIMLFQNNPDLFPRTRQYDKDLADRVMEIGKAYEYKVNGKVIGYHTNMQPIINSIRADLAKSRGVVAGTASARTEQQRQQAANQPRTEAGQFSVDGPQAGIESKAGMNGETEEDYSTFIKGMGVPTNLFL